MRQLKMEQEKCKNNCILMTYASWFTYLITYEPVNQYFVKFKIIMKFNWSDIALFEYYHGNMNFDTINVSYSTLKQTSSQDLYLECYKLDIHKPKHLLLSAVQFGVMYFDMLLHIHCVYIFHIQLLLSNSSQNLYQTFYELDMHKATLH